MQADAVILEMSKVSSYKHLREQQRQWDSFGQEIPTIFAWDIDSDGEKRSPCQVPCNIGTGTIPARGFSAAAKAQALKPTPTNHGLPQQTGLCSLQPCEGQVNCGKPGALSFNLNLDETHSIVPIAPESPSPASQLRPRHHFRERKSMVPSALSAWLAQELPSSFDRV